MKKVKRNDYIEPMVVDKKGNLYVSAEFCSERLTVSEIKLIKIVEYIRTNYTNNDDLNDIWHSGFQEIYEICVGDCNEDI